MLDVHASTEEKSDDWKDSFYQELEQVFDYFPKYSTKILLGDGNAKLGEDIVRQTVWIESLNENSTANGVRGMNSATSKERNW